MSVSVTPFELENAGEGTSPFRLEDVPTLDSTSALEVTDVSDQFAAFEEVLPDLLSGDPKITRFDVESASPVEL